MAKSRLKLKKVEKITRPLRYDLIQNPYNYTVKGTNRFQGLYLIDTVPEGLWTEVHNIVHEPISRKRQKGKMVVCGDLTNS